MFEDLNLVYFIRIDRLEWIGHVNGMDVDRILKSIFYNKTERNRIRSRFKNRYWNYVQVDRR